MRLVSSPAKGRSVRRDDQAFGMKSTRPTSSLTARPPAVVHAQQIHLRGAEFLPHRRLVGRRPETDLSSRLVRLAHEISQLGAFGLVHRPVALPLEELLPVLADQRHEVGGESGAQVPGPSVKHGVSRAVSGQFLPGRVAADDRCHRSLGHLAVFNRGQDVGVPLEDRSQFGVGGGGLGLEVDQQEDRRPAGVDPSSV